MVKDCLKGGDSCYSGVYIEKTDWLIAGKYCAGQIIMQIIMERRIHVTGDGSNTLFVPELNEFYHSAKGAYSESMHVFIDSGFKKVAEHGNINILEVGFGTGLNCLLTLVEAVNQNISVFYDSLEPFPLDWRLVEKLGYIHIVDFPGAEKCLEILHQSSAGTWMSLNKLFSFRKNIVKIEDARLPACKYDLIYYDAYAPKAQPAMWTPDKFLKIFDSMRLNGVFVTYCSRGQVRRDLQNTGFEVERLPGPPGKKEMLRAIKR